jgi:hypothetical protein
MTRDLAGGTTLTAKGSRAARTLTRAVAHLVPATAMRLDQEMTVPKSRVRSKAVYTPPPKSAKAKVSPRWLVPTMLGSLLAGLAWISVYYVSNQNLPVSALGAWNLVVGFGFIVSGVVLSTKWH